MTLQKKQSTSARFAAIKILLSLYNSRYPVKQIFDKVVVKYLLPVKDRSLVMQLVYGVLRHRQSLDRILEILSKTPLRKLDPFVHQALAVGLYQLFFLERIPESAAVNEAVENCKAGKIHKRLHGFVNGILRQAIRQKSSLQQKAVTDRAGHPIHNHPDWMVKRWQKHFGVEEASRICQSNSSEPILVLRVNTLTITRNDFCQTLDDANIACRPGVYSEEAIILPDFHGSITSIPGYKEGYFQVQDEAAQLASYLLGPFQTDGRYLDGCAGLGGKTSHLLQLTRQLGAEVHAVEPEPHRLKKLMENFNRLFPDHNPQIFEGSLQQFLSDSDGLLFNGVLIDAPCSGTGVTGRHPDIRWNRQANELTLYQQEQQILLEAASQLVCPDGILVYATCSLEVEENQDVIDNFLADHPEFTLTDCSSFLPKAAHSLVENNFFVPHPSATIDGFFAARMQRI